MPKADGNPPPITNKNINNTTITIKTNLKDNHKKKKKKKEIKVKSEGGQSGRMLIPSPKVERKRKLYPF